MPMDGYSVARTGRRQGQVIVLAMDTLAVRLQADPAGEPPDCDTIRHAERATSTVLSYLA